LLPILDNHLTKILQLIHHPFSILFQGCGIIMTHERVNQTYDWWRRCADAAALLRIEPTAHSALDSQSISYSLGVVQMADHAQDHSIKIASN
jgi:hypothetical protein